MKIDNIIAFKVTKSYWNENEEEEYSVVWPDENLDNKKYPHRFLFGKKPMFSFKDDSFYKIARPTVNSLRRIMISSPDGELARGSARSISGCNITAAIAKQHDLLISFGGHPMAAGLALVPENIPSFRRALAVAVEEDLGAVSLEPTLEVDAYIPLSALTLELVADLERLSPFGPGTPALILASEDMTLKNHTSIGRNDEHLQLTEEMVKRLRTETPEVRRMGGVSHILGTALFSWGKLERVEELWQETKALAERTQHPVLVLLSVSYDAYKAFLEGRLEDALALSQSIETHSVELGFHSGAVYRRPTLALDLGYI